MSGAAKDIEPHAKAERFLRAAQREGKAQLTVYLGAAPGVGKTFRMLQEAARKQADGRDVVVGVAETHGRSETAALLEPLEVLPRRVIEHEGHTLDEFDIDEALERRPDLIMVDELAHTNAPGSRHPKRWQDVAELLAAGIDVATTVNIQHIESLNDVVAGFTHVRVRETVPDSILDDAELIVVDLPPEALIERLEAGKVYLPETAGRALSNFFVPTRLAALRELALRFAARNVDRRLIEDLRISGDTARFAAGERLMVAVSAGEGGAQVIRQAKRLADMLHAPWTAVVVESGSGRTAKGAQREQLAENLALASSLGASLLTIAAERVGPALVQQARELKATQIVIGKSRRSRWFEWRHGSVAKEVIRDATGVSVHVVPLEEADRKPERESEPHPYRDPLLALFLVCGTVGLIHAAQQWISPSAVDLLLLVPVILSASLLRMSGAIWSAVWAALAFNFFFTEPVRTFTIDSSADVITFVVLATVAGVIGWLAARVRRQAETSAGIARLNASLARFAGLMGTVSDDRETAKVACREIAGLLDVLAIVVNVADDNMRVLSHGDTEHTLDMVDTAAARRCLETGEATGRDTGTLNASDWQFHPLKTALGTMGALGIARPDGGRVVRPDDAILLASLVDQTALAHERLVLERQAREVDVLSERDRMRGALLGSLAHDLKTPLTAVIAASDAIPAEGQHAEEVMIARSEARRLARFMGDLLEASRIESGSLEPATETVDLVDLANAAIDALRSRDPSGRIAFTAEADCPLVKADPVLTRHILINLIDNALKYSPGDAPVEVGLECDENKVWVTVSDKGEGLPEDADRLFERFQRIEGSDRAGGSGLGLWIVKNFAEIQGLSIVGKNHSNGAAFELSWPQDRIVRSPEG